MRGFALFVAGVLVGTAVHTIVAQSQQPLVRLNHVGVAVPDVAEALAWYTDKMSAFAR